MLQHQQSIKLWSNLLILPQDTMNLHFSWKRARHVGTTRLAHIYTLVLEGKLGEFLC